MGMTCQESKRAPLLIAELRNFHGSDGIVDFGDSSPWRPLRHRYTDGALARLTGFANREASLGGKWLELLSEIAPGLKRAATIAGEHRLSGSCHASDGRNHVL
jgi:hypothetical protein